jgi:hypothetical protein
VSVERLLQSRASEGDEEERPRPPQDETLPAAVERMTAEAEAAGKERLILAPREWEELVQRHMADPDMFAFSREIIDRVGDVANTTELDRWLALAHNIWNNTPQPDRGGRTPNELSRELHQRW